MEAKIFGFGESGHSAVATNSLYLPEKKKTGSGILIVDNQTDGRTDGRAAPRPPTLCRGDKSGEKRKDTEA